MVDLTITPANVVAGSNASKTTGTAGEALAAGQLVYLDSTSKRYMLVDTNHATIAEAKRPTGIALHAAANNQPITVLTKGDITIGATLVAGTDYYASDTPGGICPRADVGATEEVTLVGLATSTSVIAVDFQHSGVTL